MGISTNDTFSVNNPADGSLIAEVAKCGTLETRMQLKLQSMLKYSGEKKLRKSDQIF